MRIRLGRALPALLSVWGLASCGPGALIHHPVDGSVVESCEVELVIRAVALSPSSSPQDDGCPAADSSSAAASQASEATVEACVKEVLRILRRSRER